MGKGKKEDKKDKKEAEKEDKEDGAIDKLGDYLYQPTLAPPSINPSMREEKESVWLTLFPANQQQKTGEH